MEYIDGVGFVLEPLQRKKHSGKKSLRLEKVWKPVK